MQHYVVEEANIVEHISIGKLWEILDADCIRPWYHRSWLFPRDPHFQEKAAPILDLYQGFFEERVLTREEELVVCFDQKTSIQARQRKHVSRPAHPQQRMQVEHEYERRGALNLFCLLNVFEGKVFGRLYEGRGRAETERLLGEALQSEPYRSAKTIHLVLDNGSCQHPSTFPAWLQKHYPQVRVYYVPVHASWLNQIEIYFSILQRKALTPNDFESLEALREHLMAFQEHYNHQARPFNWKFTRQDLEQRLSALS